MRLTFPHMGPVHIGITTIFRDLGVDIVAPPPITRRTVALGVKHSPEMACFPLKISVGNYLEARELGVDTIGMLGGVGPCRLGYYADVEREILDGLGAGMEMVVLDPPQGKPGRLLRAISRLTGGKPLRQVWRSIQFGWSKIVEIDRLDQEVPRARVFEAQPGVTRAVRAQAYRLIEEASSVVEAKRAGDLAVEALRSISLGHGAKSPQGRPLTVGLVGEIYMLLEPAANMDLEERLGRLGVITRRALTVSDWVRLHLFPGPWKSKDGAVVHAAARPYLNHFVGGEGVESVGQTVLYQRMGLDGVIHVGPLTCMPEIVAASVLPQVARDLDFPVMTLFLDEHSGEAGIQTRLEAFVDLLRRRRQRQREQGTGRFGATSARQQLAAGLGVHGDA